MTSSRLTGRLYAVHDNRLSAEPRIVYARIAKRWVCIVFPASFNKANMRDPAAFVLASIAILATPGPTNTLLATSGATVGFRRSLSLIGSETAGYLLSVVLIGEFFRRLLERSSSITTAAKTIVALYLLVLAAKLWRYNPDHTALISPLTSRQMFLTTILNPKATIFALVIVPFGAPDPWIYVGGLSALFVIFGVGWVGAGAILRGAAGPRQVMAIVPRAGAIVVGGFGVAMLCFTLFPFWRA